jgi:hypothetical protein
MVVARMFIRLLMVKCRGCNDPFPHSHHLSRLGRVRYLGWRAL